MAFGDSQSAFDLREVEQLEREMRDLIKRIGDFKDVLSDFFYAWVARREKRWDEMKVATGGDFFGKRWPKMKDQYTRKLDGQVVPAWGGVPRIKAQFVARGGGPGAKIGLGWHRTKDGRLVRNKTWGGNVKGRLRKGRKNVRIKPTDVLMRDTGTMFKSVFLRPSKLTNFELVVAPHGMQDAATYAPHQNAMRPFLFWEEGKDENALKTLVVRKISRWCADNGWSRDYSDAGRDGPIW